MELTQETLAPLFRNIVRVLSATPGQLEQFEDWANAQALRLKRAAESGKAYLAFEAELLRGSAEQLTKGSEQMKLCQRIWITALIRFVDALLADDAPESGGPANDNLQFSLN